LVIVARNFLPATASIRAIRASLRCGKRPQWPFGNRLIDRQIRNSPTRNDDMAFRQSSATVSKTYSKQRRLSCCKEQLEPVIRLT
jgi:hypothetical protein